MCFKFADAARTQTIRFLNLNVFGKMFSIEAFAQLKCPDIGMNWFIGLESFVSIIFIGDWEDFFSSEKAFRGDGGKWIKRNHVNYGKMRKNGGRNRKFT